MTVNRTIRADALVTVAAVRSYLNIQTAVQDQEELFVFLINTVTGRFNQYCARNLKTRTYAGSTALTADGDGTSSVVVPHHPVTNLTAAKYRDSLGSLASLVITGWWADVNEIYLLQSVFPKGRGNIVIECEAGYKADIHDSELDALEYWATRMVEIAWIDRNNQIGRGVSANMAGGSITLINGTLPKDVEAGLAPFRGW
jgi:hypothetical protein